MASSSDATCLKSDSMDSEPQRVRRGASKKCPGLHSLLPNWVSHWKRSHIERILHIYYEDISSEIPEVLEKIPKIKQLNSRQAEHLEILNNTNFGPDFNLREVYYNNRKTKKLLREALVEVKSGFNDSIMRADARTSTSSG